MKRTSMAAAVLLTVGLSLSGAGAATLFVSQNSLENQITKAVPGGENGKTGNMGRTSARPTGLLYGIWTHGPLFLSPTAPKEYGIGQQYVTLAPAAPDTVHGTLKNERADDFGGLKLFGFDF